MNERVWREKMLEAVEKQAALLEQIVARLDVIAQGQAELLKALKAKGKEQA